MIKMKKQFADTHRSWPGGNSLTSDKVPTEISYDPPPPARNSRVLQETNSAFNNDVRWGFQFKPDEPRLRCLKLFLDRNQTLPSFVSSIETAAQLKRHEKTVLDAASDYLRKLNEHTIQTLNRRYGDNFVATTEIQYVLTVPAVWSDAAKMATLTAAEMAGMGSRQDIRMISEPEAAALYTLTTAQSAGLKVGDNFVVCDAGGGTVDLIAYKAKSLSPLRVEETAVGTGGLCGSAFLNYRFEDHVRQRIGKETYEMMREKKPKTWMMGLRFFEENVKRNFDPTDARAEEVNVPFPGLPDDEEAGLDSGFLSMSAEQVKDIFDPVIDEIIALLEGQIDSIRERGEVVSGIILVGGFGSSDYLYKRMRQHFGGALTSDGEEGAALDVAGEPNGDATPSIEVMQPLYAWTAVVRGAVLSGMEGDTVERRRSRRHYGTTYATVYDETKHTEKERYWSPMWERWMVSNRMQWHIAKVSKRFTPPGCRPVIAVVAVVVQVLRPVSDNMQNTPIASDAPIIFHYTRNFRTGQSLVVEDEVIACDEDDAPPQFRKSLHTVCTLRTDLSNVPRCLFEKLVTTKGIEFQNLDFELHMKIQSANLVFELVIAGISYGSIAAEFH